MSDEKWIEVPPNSTDKWEYCDTCGWYPKNKHDGYTHAWFDQLDEMEKASQ